MSVRNHSLRDVSSENTEEFDFTDLDVFAKDIPHESFKRLRRSAPVYWNPAPTIVKPNDGFWLITKHSDIAHIEGNTALFSSHYGLTLADAPSEIMGPPWSMVRDGLAHLDPPAHSIHRQIVAPSFTPRAVEAMEAEIRKIAIETLERACAMHEFDFASEVALRFPVAVVLGTVLGLPAEDFARAVRWSDVIVAPNDPEFSRKEASTVVHEIYDYALSTLAVRRREPKNDVLSVLAHTKTTNEEYLGDEMFLRIFWSLITGAFDTTASAISGGMLAFIEFPEQYERAVRSSSLLPTAVEEILRWETPTIYFRRTATSDTEIRGRKIRRGDRVVMCYASANRDEEKFVDPNIFDISRKPNDHLSFGHGKHFCLGASLARAEIRVLFELITQRNLRFELRGNIRRARSNFQNRIKQMPVSIIH
jgi:cholest-4-en-3-one 26-monooxygenase